MLRLRVRLEDDWCKPRFKLLLCYVSSDKTKAVVPERLMIIIHLANVTFLLNYLIQDLGL